MTERPEILAGVSNVDCTGLQALVRVSTSGIGCAVAAALTRLGTDGVVHGRNPQFGAVGLDELARTGLEQRLLVSVLADVGAVRPRRGSTNPRRLLTSTT